MTTASEVRRQVLAKFAAVGFASSRWEAFGHGQSAAVDDAIHALCDAGLLVPLAYTTTHDAHGGTRFRVTAAGFRELGQAVRAQRVPPAPKASYETGAMYGARLAPARN